MESGYHKRYAQFLQLYSGIKDSVPRVPKMPKVREVPKVSKVPRVPKVERTIGGTLRYRILGIRSQRLAEKKSFLN